MELFPNHSSTVLYIEMSGFEKLKEVIEALSERKLVLIKVEENKEDIYKTLRNLSTYGNSIFELVKENVYMIDPVSSETIKEKN